jgi:hypothetical protein
MATRSNIAYKTAEGKIRSIYCHWDGYPEHNGEMLRRHYTTTEKVAALIELGSLSSLRPELGEQQDFDNRDTQKEDWCLAYHRDRGEELHISEYDDIPSWIEDMEEYAYLWNGQDWLVNDHGATRGGFPVFDFVETAQRKDVMDNMGWETV